MKPTNDANEGALGGFQRSKRHSQNETLAYYNAKTMYKANGTGDYIANTLQAPAQQMFLQKKACKISMSGQTQKLRKVQAIYDHDKAEQQVQAKLVREKKTQEKASMLRSVEPVLAPEDITETLTIAQLDLQIDWHKQYDKTITKSRYKGKTAKVATPKEIVIASGCR